LTEPGAGGNSFGFELNNPTQGTGFYNRVGSKITMTSINIKFDVDYVPNAQTGAIAAPINYRCVLVYDRQTNGAFPTVSQIFSSNVSGVPSYYFLYAGVNIQFRQRFMIIRDESGVLDTAQGLSHHKEWFAKIRQPVEFIGNTGTNPQGVIGDVATGALYFIYAADTRGSSTVDTVPSCKLNNFFCRTRYYG